MSIASFSRRKILTSAIAAFTATAGLASSSCASPRLPAGGTPLRSSAGGYELQVLLEGTPAQTFEHAGETYVLGQLGARYTLRILNHTGRRIEAVASVDGRDAIDGKPADVRTKRGYLVPAWGSVDIDGWRLSRAEVAAFRFSSVADSYAARTGSAREVGVIGVAVFPERYVPPPRPVLAPPVYPRYPRDYEPRDDARGLGALPPVHRESYGYNSSGDAPAKSTRPAPRTAEAESAPPSASPAPPASASPASPSRSSSSAGAGTSSRADSLSAAEPSPRRRPGLGTEFGEAVSSRVQEVSFERAHSTYPAVVLGARYNDRDGLVALGIDVDGCCTGEEDLAWRQTATPFPTGEHRYAAPPAGWRDGCCVRY